MQIEANGGVIEYEQDGSGPPLLLMHGGEGDLTQWDDVVPMLADEFTVIRYNQRDTGASRSDDHDYTFEDLGDDAAALLEALGHARAHVLGSSFGGALAQQLALGHPDRVDRLVVCMIGTGKTEFRDGTPVLEGCDEAATAVIQGALAGDADARRELRKLFFSKEALARDPDLPLTLASAATRRPPEQTARRMAAFHAWTSEGRLAEIKAKTLVIAGAGDQILRAHEPWELATGLPHATLVRFDEIGHVWSREAPDRVVRLVKLFLNDEI